ncbi:glutamyl-tRNA(Gln) amidotransferase subunit A [Variibacter gotjawalensis]|uniref:Glutamyl-tRNA(Gln) amidotransferase subunit A n=1 Tax=Variibacter gotjawalensis TaxID=1333996 RepID=A0A0S3PW12_9BRAD|nr:amidase [Variibacter gotjawalensis]NIK45904.1 aspartyl-tRNA(Asn)/glutamyl-tRNA(Gln) amidotransferase subunit A [Variibacter gotjawalensis]RZS47824.1 aspartyl-tRNA(Asn)/glutamyl-tRNA(Gln) amidotransferase subunit A [Variibacter gotjawalensis]BAT60078.1 glutamyl-tRNA(Gln) amidotransferase subunit A [Variibacter gotjawalensis]
MTAIHDLTAIEILKRYRDRSLSPSEVWDAVEKQIALWEPHLDALYAYEPERARAEAKAATERWANGKPNGELDGVPVSIKENIPTKGVPVPLGTAVTTLTPAADDAPAAARLREQGAIIFAKTTMPDFGMTSSGLSSFHKTARNPWDTSKTPGGSSAGAGAAAAAGYGPLHVGTDIGGSVRLPAGWCGLATLKPSLGRIPVDPPYVGRVIGPMTRTVGDTALMMKYLSQPDWRDSMSLPPHDIVWHDLAREVKGLRIGLLLGAGYGLPVDPEVKAAVEAAAKQFADAGAIIEPVQPIMTQAMIDGLNDFWRARMWGDFEALSEATRKKALPYIQQWAEGGAKITGAQAVRGFNQTMAMRAAAAKLFSTVDYVLSPTAPVPAFPAELSSPIDDAQKPFEHIGFTVPWNMTEQPASSINCGFTKAGLPIGLQIIGRRFDDLGVLQLTHAYEAWRGPITWPTAP